MAKRAVNKDRQKVETTKPTDDPGVKKTEQKVEPVKDAITERFPLGC